MSRVCIYMCVCVCVYNLTVISDWQHAYININLVGITFNSILEKNSNYSEVVRIVKLKYLAAAAAKQTLRDVFMGL